MYLSSRRGFLRGVSIAIGLVALRRAGADKQNIPLDEGFVDLPLTESIDGSVIVKKGGPVILNWTTDDGQIARAFSNITFLGSYNSAYSATDTVEATVLFSFLVGLASTNYSPGIDYAFYSGNRRLS